MTKEELKKEAIQYAIDYPTSYGNGYKHKDLRIAYLAGAEPREKRIDELEKENAELKAYNEKLLDGDIEKHNKIVELQAEVTSLKNKCRQYENGYAYEKLYELRVQAENKLDEAKKLIKQIIRVTWSEGWNYSLQVKVEAEKFLKECE